MSRKETPKLLSGASGTLWVLRTTGMTTIMYAQEMPPEHAVADVATPGTGFDEHEARRTSAMPCASCRREGCAVPSRIRFMRGGLGHSAR